MERCAVIGIGQSKYSKRSEDHSIDGLYQQNDQQHTAIRQALAAGSATGARSLAREHVLSSFRMLETILEQVGAQPADWHSTRSGRRSS